MLRQIPRRRLPRLAALLLAAAAGSLVLASSAVAAPTAPGNLSVSPSSPMQSRAPTVSWTGSTPDDGQAIDHYEGGLAAGTTPVSSPGPVSPSDLGDGNYTFSVRAVQTDGTPSDYAQVGFTVDNGLPTVTVGFSAPANVNGWRKAPLSIVPSCSDALSAIVSGCGSFAWTTEGLNVAVGPVTATDAAGNQGSGSATVSYDATPPTTAGGLLSEPLDGSPLASEPLYRWTRGDDALSGPDRYELEWRTVGDDTWQVIARVSDTGLGDYTARRDPALRAAPLPEQQLLEWRVRTFDKAGNFRNSIPYRLTIDSTIPPPPVITGGPSTPIPFTSPVFTWTGTQETYLWDLFVPGRTNPVRTGSGPATEVTLQSLADGDYTFRVIQLTPFGQRSEGATRSFKVDTTPPVAPEITIRPPFPAAGVITFGWSQEPGAFSRWQVNGAGGAVILGPADSVLNSVSIANLADGAYSFQVMQIDPAGNGSATTVEPFTVTTPLAPGAPPSGNPKIEPAFLLPTQNAFRLRPKAGRTVPTRRPVLGWRKGPRGTRLYNVQIFKVIKKRAGKAPTVKKVYSGFPSKRQMRAPRAKMQPGACYVWRVWPYTGTRFTPKPLGISNFCVAKASVLKKKAIQAARRKAAQRRR